MAFELVKRRHSLGALAVLVSTVVTPIAEVHWMSTFLGIFDDELYFIWGSYSLYDHRKLIYGSRANNPYLILGL
ncbi:MAG: hypothetical protein ACXABY_30480 [Candidatus Thorarchaeota archaeon]|jgi:hypothetical protein